MTDPFDITMTLRGLRAYWNRNWEWELEQVAHRLDEARQGRPGNAAVDMSRSLVNFAIVAPATVATNFCPLAVTLKPAFADKAARSGSEHGLGIYEVSMANAANALECVGCEVDHGVWSTLRSWMSRLEVGRNDADATGFWTAGLIALALGETTIYRRVAGARGSGPIGFTPGETFVMNVRGYLLHLAGAIESAASIDDVMPGFLEVLRHYERLEADAALDQGALLWMARVVHHVIGRQPLDTTAQFLHDALWELAGESAA